MQARIPWVNNRKAQTVTEFAVLGVLIIVAFAFLINYSEKINRQQAYLQQTFRAALTEARSANNSASYTKVVFNRMPNVSRPLELGQVQSFSNSSNVLWQDGKDSWDEDGRNILGVAKYQLNEEVFNIPQHETLNSLIIDLEQYSDPQGTIAPVIADLKDIQTALEETSPDYQAQQESLNSAVSSLTGISGIDASVISGLQEVINSLPVGTTALSTDTFTNKVDATATFTRREVPGAITTSKTLTAKDILEANVKIGDSQRVIRQSLGQGGKYYLGEDSILERSKEMQ